MPEGAVYVGRPTRWGNPCDWRAYPTMHHDAEGEAWPISDAERRRFAVSDFEAEVVYGAGRRASYPSDEEIRRELRGRHLVCWCPLDQPCHADLLLRIANSPEGLR
ncbi:DUF4326 domain-containing protein [Amycolatopsis thermophila]|uniref:DUF4326 domain-containing protein n=1 Tax=Amycolatopsis thermophila TaxID=206084 RepID=A0ABU0EMT3_9PSEU|nr:hypothetical protein [Amycolatopsis thermophila]